MSEPPSPAQRVSRIPLPERYALPARPEGVSTQVQDAYRQTTFILGGDLRLFDEGMNLQLAIAQDASHSSFRTHPYAALMGLWSRTFTALADCCLLVTRGSYSSCAPLARVACEYIAAEQELHVARMSRFLEWLAENFTPNDTHKAIEFGLGRYFAGETIANDSQLRRIYRPASELGRPSFGATALLLGPESNHQRLALSFADASFHLGWAEIATGWLLSLCERQVAAAVHAEGVFPADEERHRTYQDYARRIDGALSRPDRCSIEEIEDGPDKRYLVHNFRRAPGGAPKRVLL